MQTPLINLPPFYVGQLVTCIESHPDLPIVRKGNQFTVLGIKMGCHNNWQVDIGISGNDKGVLEKCTVCNKTGLSDGIWWIGAFRFTSTKESSFPSMTAKEIVTKELKLVSMN